MRGAVGAVAAAVALGGCGGDRLGDNSQVFVLDRAGGEPRQVTHDADHDYTAPAWSPRGDRLASSSDSGISLFSPDGNRLRDFHLANVNNDTPLAWSRDGRRLAFETTYDNRSTGSTDAHLVTLAVGSGAVRTLADVASDTPSWTRRDHSLVYLTGDLVIDEDPVRVAIWSVDASGGRPHRIVRGAADHFAPQISADGRRLLFARRNSVWVARPDGRRQRRLASGVDLPVATWAPNGRDVTTVTSETARSRAFVVSPSGRRRALPALIRDGPVAWSPDGRLIAWARRGGETTIDAVRPDGSGHRVLMRLGGGVEVSGLSWSPDGRRLALAASRSNAD
jgi:Tol biopolymer transport system component